MVASLARIGLANIGRARDGAAQGAVCRCRMAAEREQGRQLCGVSGERGEDAQQPNAAGAIQGDERGRRQTLAGRIADRAYHREGETSGGCDTGDRTAFQVDRRRARGGVYPALVGSGRGDPCLAQQKMRAERAERCGDGWARGIAHGVRQHRRGDQQRAWWQGGIEATAQAEAQQAGGPAVDQALRRGLGARRTAAADGDWLAKPAGETRFSGKADDDPDGDRGGSQKPKATRLALPRRRLR